MKTEYDGIEIEYIEGTNDWHFELRGRRRKADSLAKAKDAIDKEPKEKRAPFPRFDCYRFRYSREPEVVTVTSIAEDQYDKGTTFWVSEKDGKGRSKEKDIYLHPVNDHNDALLAQIKAKQAEGAAIDKEIGALKAKLQIATIPESVR